MIATAIAIGLVVGLATGGLGGGGSVLTVPALVFLLGESPHAAATASLVIVGISAVSGLAARARSGDIQWRPGLVFGLVGSAAAVGGTILSRGLNPNVLLLAFAALVLVAAYFMVRKSAPDPAPDPAIGPGPAATTGTEAGTETGTEGGGEAGGGVSTLAPVVATARPGALVYAGKVAVIGAAVGLSTGLFGVGGGFLVVPALAVILGWSMPAAVATSLLVIVLNAVSSLGARLTEAFDWRVIAIVTVASVIGTLLGKRFADRTSSVALARCFAGLLVLVALYTATTSVLALS